MMDILERHSAKTMLDRLKNILPELKLAYANAKSLELDYNWDIDSFQICEAYMTLADEYIGVMQALEEEDRGGAE